MKSILLSSLGLSILLSACSQPPAPVADKGALFFGKHATTQLAGGTQSAAPSQLQAGFEPERAPTRLVEAAPVDMVQSLQVAELPQAAPPATLQQAEAPMEPEPVYRTASFTAEPQPAAQTAAAVAKPVAGPEPETEMLSLAPLPMDMIEQQASLSNPVVQAAVAEADAAPQRFAADKSESSTFIWPAEGRIVSRFGPKQNGLVNDGINIEAGEGEPIWAAAQGEVVYAGNELKGYGKMMILRHAGGWMTAYAHASDMLVAKGDRVEQGDLIGYVGKTGAVNTAQLHFGIREGKKPVDPETLLPRRVASAQ